MDNDVAAWLQRDPDPKTRAELRELLESGQHADIEARFRGRLSFGTAGLRGIVGAGPARMNRLVVRETTAGLGAYLAQTVARADARGVVVGFDGRPDSALFASDAAAVLTAMGFRVYQFEHLCPTPLCAFAVQHLDAAAGIMITASHNPPEYNGYKVYWENGAQIVPPHDQGIARAIEHAASQPVPWTETPAVEPVGEAVRQAYLRGIAELSIHPPGGRDAVVIAYTPLHGVGAELAETALARAGFQHVHTVAAQREPDGSFPTVRFPNPEEPGAMDAVVELGRQCGADLVFANDPDADRLAVAVRADGDYRVLTGNEIGVLLGWDRLQPAPRRSVVATTIVSSRLLQRIANAWGASYFETLTGFKWIAHGAIEHRQAHPEQHFVFGYEEALGYTIGELVRDKDGISALVAFAQMAAALRQRGRSVLDQLESIYRTYGLHLTAQKSLALDPAAPGPLPTERLRTQPPDRVAGRSVTEMTDVQTGVRRQADGTTTPTQLPASDVLIFCLEDDSRVIVRPSGTEPKLKCYYELHVSLGADEDMSSARTRGETALEALIAAHQRELAAL